MKDTITIIAAILIICLVADGLRRAYISRNGKIRVSPNVRKRMRKQSDMADDDLQQELSHEFPNGGARVVSKREARNQQSALDLRDPVPLLMDEVGAPRERIEPTFTAAQPASQYQNEALDYSADDYDYPAADKEADDPLFRKREATAPLDSERDNYHDNYQVTHRDTHREDEAEVATGRNTGAEDDDTDPYDRDYDSEYPDDDYERDERDDEAELDDYLDEHYEDDEYQEDAPGAQPAVARNEIRQAEPEEVLVINIMASGDNLIDGGALLDAVLRCGMRFGDMDIFHRYSDSKGEGALLFSMVNMVKPGVFDLDTMDDFTTPGVCLFMTLPLNADSMQSFELMVNTAHTIAEEVGGELKDEHRSAMTRQTIEHCRQRILDFERRRLFQRKR